MGGSGEPGAIGCISGPIGAALAHAVVPAEARRREVAYEWMLAEARMPEFLGRYEAARRLQMLECAAPLIVAMEDAADGQLPIVNDLTREQVLGLAVPSTAEVPVRGGWLNAGVDLGFLDFLHPVRIVRPNPKRGP